jgi:hypothetical protein
MIAAGGYGSRLKLGTPKCAIEFGGRTLLEIGARQAILAGANRILVLCNNLQWVDSAKYIASQIPNCEVLQDLGHETTFDLCRSYAPLMGEDFLFLYSHAPRKSSVLEPILHDRRRKQAAGLVSKSSRRVPIELNSGFLEPPFRVHREAIVKSIESSWREYVFKRITDFSIFPLNGPPEFNNALERDAYLKQLAWAA